jgi:gamma-glutamyltranspeptidase/glutathione hydrolase
VSPAVIKGLAELGHDVTPWPEWTGSAGSIGAVKVDHTTGVRHGGADPRRVAYAIGR